MVQLVEVTRSEVIRNLQACPVELPGGEDGQDGSVSKWRNRQVGFTEPQ